MREVKKPSSISLVSFSNVLVTNFTRLKSIGLEHEMSNVSAMFSILQKFPSSFGEKWQESLAAKTSEEKAKSFPALI